MKRRLLARRYVVQRGLLLLSMLLVVGAACSQRSLNSAASPEIRIGVIASMSGDNAEVGVATMKGARLAVQEINAQGGLEVDRQKHRVVLFSEDDRDGVDTALDAARRLIYQKEVVAIVGPQFSRNAIPVAKFVETAQVPMISPRSTNPETTAGKRYVFRATFVDTVQGQVLARFAAEELAAQQAAVLYDIASPYNRGLAEVFRQAFEAAGGRVVAFESYTTGIKDFQPHLRRIRDQQPDVLFLPNYESEVPLQAQQAREIGIRATLLGSDSWSSVPADRFAPLNGSFFSDQYSPDSTNDQTQAFIQRYRQAYGEAPNGVAAATYDSLGLLFKAIGSRGSQPDAIRQGLAAIAEYNGVTGRIQYQGTGDPQVSIVILQVKDDRPVFYKQVDP